MGLARFWRHVLMTPAKARRAFPEALFDRLEREITRLEQGHRGEVVFVMEAELPTLALWRGETSRERAIEVFAAQGVWDTEENNGVLVYVLLAEHRVEIVADRGIGSRVPEPEWRAICDAMDRHFAAGRYEEGAMEGVREVSRLLAAHYPASGAPRDELGNRPIRL